MPRLSDWRFAEILAGSGIAISKEEAERARQEFNSNNGKLHGTGLNEEIKRALNRHSTEERPAILLGILDPE